MNLCLQFFHPLDDPFLEIFIRITPHLNHVEVRHNFFKEHVLVLKRLAQDCLKEGVAHNGLRKRGHDISPLIHNRGHIRLDGEGEAQTRIR